VAVIWIGFDLFKRVSINGFQVLEFDNRIDEDRDALMLIFASSSGSVRCSCTVFFLWKAPLDG
jgi:hypothetical protein